MSKYRVMIRGESWIGETEFGSDPAIGDVFAMPSGTQLKVEQVLDDPIDDPNTPDKLIHATRA